MLMNKDNLKEELTLGDVVKILRSQWQWVVGMPLFTLAVASVVVQLIPTRFEANVLMQIGQPLSLGSASAVEFEPAQHLIERINSKGFLLRLHEKSEGDSSLSASPVRGTKLVRLTVTSHSGDEAARIVQKASDLIVEDYKVFAESSELFYDSRLKLMQKHLDITLSSLKHVQDSDLNSSSDLSSEPSRTLLRASIHDRLLETESALTERIFELERAIANAKKLRTTVLEPIQVSTISSRIMYPIAFIALVIGTVIGVLTGFLKHASKK